jgi:hypothetical protein
MEEQQVIVRRPRWRPVRSYLILFGVLGAVAAALSRQSGWLIVPAVLLLGLAAFIALATARGRTEITADGVRNRLLFRLALIPWSDIRDVVVSARPPRSVKVVRANGLTTALVAGRDAGVHPDGLTVDDIADVIRERASAPDPVLPEARPLSLRPSRLPLVWVLPAAVAALAAATVLRGVIAFYLLVIGVLLGSLALKLMKGRTEAEPDGLRNRLISRTATVPWKDVDGIAVIPTLFGRIVEIRTKGGSRIRLAAPREGLLDRSGHLDDHVATVRALAGSPTPSLAVSSVRAARTTYVVLIVAVVVLAVASGKF